MPSRHSSKILVLMTCVALSGCGRILYQPDVQQGNVLTARELQGLKLGMTKEQVSFLLGSPPIRDPFHRDRWDYYYSYQEDGGRPIGQAMTLRFKDGKLASITGAVRPTPPIPQPAS